MTFSSPLISVHGFMEANTYHSVLNISVVPRRQDIQQIIPHYIVSLAQKSLKTRDLHQETFLNCFQSVLRVRQFSKPYLHLQTESTHIWLPPVRIHNICVSLVINEETTTKKLTQIKNDRSYHLAESIQRRLLFSSLPPERTISSSPTLSFSPMMMMMATAMTVTISSSPSFSPAPLLLAALPILDSAASHPPHPDLPQPNPSLPLGAGAMCVHQLSPPSHTILLASPFFNEPCAMTIFLLSIVIFHMIE